MDLVCMVTPDVPKDICTMLAKVYTNVVKVDYIVAQPEQRRHKFSKDMYDPWIHFSLTKLNMLRLEGYDSVMFLDADTLALQSPDELFEIAPPAGICSSRLLLKDRFLDFMLHAEVLPDSLVV